MEWPGAELAGSKPPPASPTISVLNITCDPFVAGEFCQGLQLVLLAQDNQYVVGFQL